MYSINAPAKPSPLYYSPFSPPPTRTALVPSQHKFNTITHLFTHTYTHQCHISLSPHDMESFSPTRQ